MNRESRGASRVCSPPVPPSPPESPKHSRSLEGPSGELHHSKTIPLRKSQNDLVSWFGDLYVCCWTWKKNAQSLLVSWLSINLHPHVSFFVYTFPMNLQMRCVDLPWITFQAYHCNECEMSSRLCALSPLQNFKMKKREREIFENNMVIPHWWTCEEKTQEKNAKSLWSVDLVGSQ